MSTQKHINTFGFSSIGQSFSYYDDLLGFSYEVEILGFFYQKETGTYDYLCFDSDGNLVQVPVHEIH